jgi:hypothetical protein
MPLMTKVLYYGVIPLIAPLFVTYKFITDKSYRVTTCNLYSLVSTATATNTYIGGTNDDGANDVTKNDGGNNNNKSVMNGWYFQNVTLLKKLWTLKSAQAYIGNNNNNNNNNILEYQIREGYCGSATQRCILKSFGYTSTSIIGIEQIGGESKPELWCEHVKLMTSSIATASNVTNSASNNNSTTDNNNATEQVVVDSGNDEYYIETTIVYGSNVTYSQFKTILQTALSNPNVRIACNYLRSALTGFELDGLWKYHPLLILLKLYGGHFSPILGMLDATNRSDDDHQSGDEEKKKEEDGNEDEGEGADDNDGPFVAIWDTNARYGGDTLYPVVVYMRRYHQWMWGRRRVEQLFWWRRRRGSKGSSISGENGWYRWMMMVV